MLKRHSNLVEALFFDASGSIYYVFYDESLAAPPNAFEDAAVYRREHIREIARLCHAAPDTPSNLLVSYFQRRMDLTIWDSSSGESDGIGEPTFVHDQGSQPLFSEGAYADVFEPMDVDEHGV